MTRDPDSEGRGTPGTGEPRLSRASVGRLSLYLRRLESLQREGIPRVSSGLLGDSLGVSDAQVRKDLAALGNLGQPGIGYEIAAVIGVIRRILGINRTWPAILVGVGNLARALIRYKGFLERGFRIVALLDADASKVGQRLEELEIQSMDRFVEVIHATGAELAILAVPAEDCQTVAEKLASAGIRGILNFAPTVLRLPPDVQVVSVDLTVQLEQLAFLVQMSNGTGNSPANEKGTR